MRDGFLLFVVRCLVAAGILSLAGRVLSGLYVEGFAAAILAAAVLSVINVTIRPVVILLGCPLVALSGGLFLVFINAFMLYLAALVTPGLSVSSLTGALGGALLVSAGNLALSVLAGLRTLHIGYSAPGSAAPGRTRVIDAQVVSSGDDRSGHHIGEDTR